MPIDSFINAASYLGISGDMGDAVQQAISAAVANDGGWIIIPPNPDGAYWDWLSTPKVPAGLPNVLQISAYGAQIRLSSTGPRLFDLDKTADNQNFNNLILEGFNVDATNSAGKSHLIIGSRINGNFIGRFNADNWIIRDFIVKNVPTDPVMTPMNQLSIFAISPFHSAPDEEVANTITNLRFENVKAWGGNGGFQINGFNGGSSTSANVYFDNITVVDCAHYLPVTCSPYVVSNLHVGGFGSGDRLIVRGFQGTNSGDNFIEVNGMRDVSIEQVSTSGPYTYGIFLKNFKDIDYLNQSIRISGFRASMSLRTGRAFSFGDESAHSNHLGDISISDMSVVVPSGSIWSSNGTAILAYPNDPGTAGVKYCESLTIDGLTFQATLDSMPISATYTPSVVAVKLGGKSRVTLRSVRARITGSVTVSGSPTVAPRAIHLESVADAETSILIDDLDVRNEVPFQNFWMMALGGSTAGLRVTVDDWSISNAATGKVAFQVFTSPLSASYMLRTSLGTYSGLLSYFSTASQTAFATFAIDGFNEKTLTVDPDSLAPNTRSAVASTAFPGAVLGNAVSASFTRDLQGVNLFAYVNASDSVAYFFENNTAGVVDLSSGTLRLQVHK